jgi:glucosyl-3-phosphoglycerate synthase
MPEGDAERWARERTFHHSRFTASEIAADRTASVGVCLPARECALTVGPIVEALAGLRSAGVLDEILVVDAASADGTAAVARAAGADVRQESDLMPGFGPVLGKGDAMWRALSVLDTDIVCFLDADSEVFSEHFAVGLIGALVGNPGLSFVKALYERPFLAGGVRVPAGGGRVNHLAARPALAVFYPELAWVRQPLAGEMAARRDLLERLPFTTGYGIEIGMLIDAWREVGLDGLAQVDLDEHQNRHQPLSALTPMATTVLATVARRLERDGRLEAIDGAAAAPPERPPLRSVKVV